MNEEKKWHTTKEIIIECIALRFSKANYRIFEKSVWLSSEAAAQLAKRLYIAKRILDDSLLHDDERTRVEELLYEVAQELTRNNERLKA